MCLFNFTKFFAHFPAFPLICGHFDKITNEFCPEEKIHIRERSLSVVNLFLDEMSKEAKNIITTICDEQVSEFLVKGSLKGPLMLHNAPQIPLNAPKVP